MKYLAEKHLQDWIKEFNETMGEVYEPSFSDLKASYSENKEIPHFACDDGSVIVIYNNLQGRTCYESYSSEQELDEEMDNEGDTYSVVDLIR